VGAGVRLRADANQAWDAPQAIRTLDAMAAHGLELVEQPVRRHDLEGLRAVRRAARVPIMADESCFSPEDALRLIRMEAVDHLNIKLMKCGGITAALRLAAIAATASMRCMIGCMVESRLAISAALHFASATAAVAFADLDGHVDFASDPTIGPSFGEGPILAPSDEPGLGVRFQGDALARFEAVVIEE
jgi:L-alanine-DL-glutamate epimerase-like enolase superfamily enzyme